jgi:hypothetical protein
MMPETVDSRAMFRRIAARLDLDELAEAVFASFAERPEYQSVRPPDEMLRAWVRWNIGLVERWSSTGEEPTDADLEGFRVLARIAAADGTPADVILTNYRIGARVAWAAVTGVAAEEDRGALGEGAALMFEFVDRISRAFSEAYEEAARAGGSAAEERAAQGVLQRLAAREDLLAEDHRLAERIGFDPGGSLRPFVLSSPGRPASQYEVIAQRLRERRALASSRGRVVIGIAHDTPAWDELDLGATVAATYAIGEVTPSQDIGPALEELRTLVAVAVAGGHVGLIDVDDFLPQLILARSPQLAGRLHRRVYGRLSPELAQTLNSLVEHDFDRGRAAAALPVHRNTLTNRIARIRTSAGVDLDHAEGCAIAWLAWTQRGARPATSP